MPFLGQGSEWQESNFLFDRIALSSNYMAEEYKLQPVLIKSGDCKIIIYPGLVPFIRYVARTFRSILWYVNGTILSSLTNLSRSFVSRYQDARYSLWENIADVSMASSWIRKDWLIYRRWGSNYFTCPAQFLSNSLRPTLQSSARFASERVEERLSKARSVPRSKILRALYHRKF